MPEHACMSRYRRLWIAAATLLNVTFNSPQLHAQSPDAPGTGDVVTLARAQPYARFASSRQQQRWDVTSPTVADGGSRRTRRITGIALGAVAGGALLGGIAARQAARCDDCFFEGPVITLAIGAGVLGGGLLGWLVAAASE